MTDLESPLVSVVFTSYNHIKYLRQALDSLVNQTYNNIELIIVDDCSTDNSQSILREYEHLPNVILKLNSSNSGSYVKASNYGASFASGDYIMFAQCDDYSEPSQIKELILAIQTKSNVGVVFSASNLVDGNNNFIASDYDGRELMFRKKCAKDCEISGLEMRHFLSFSCVLPNLSAALIRKKYFFQVGGLPEEFPRSADWAFWLNLAEITNFFYLRKPLNNFRQHETTIRSKTKFDVYLLEIYNVLYTHAFKYNLQKQELRKIKIGAGAIWFWYFLENPKAWLQRFPFLLIKISKIEKFNIYYLFLGFLKHLKEHNNKKR